MAASDPATLTVTCPGFVTPDLDGDCDVDEDDLALFESCASAPAVPHDGTPLCGQADFDEDDDVDQSDFGKLQRCHSGEASPPDPHCED